MRKIYLACPANQVHDGQKAKAILEEAGMEVYMPFEHHVENAWDYPNTEWGLMVFQADVEAIKRCDFLVLLSYGRTPTTAGVNWEAGFAFGKGKKVIVVEMAGTAPMSVMVANGRYATVKGLDGLYEYDWDKMPMTRTNTEQM